MSRARFFVPVAVVFAVLLMLLWGGAAAQEKAKEKAAVPKTTWEYKKVSAGTLNAEASLNDLGREGWELVAVASEGKTAHVYAYLKRPKLEPAK